MADCDQNFANDKLSAIFRTRRPRCTLLLAAILAFGGLLILIYSVIPNLYQMEIQDREPPAGVENQKKVEITEDPDLKHLINDNEDGAEGKRANSICSLRERMSLCHQACSDIARSAQEDDLGVVAWALIDSVHYAVWTIIPKAGSRSWLQYFTKSIGATGTIENELRRFAQLGLNFTSKVPVAELNSRYANYTKFIVVRHPLQKFVSGYYEVIVHRKKYQERCAEIKMALYGHEGKCKPGKVLTLAEFAQAFAKGLLPQNEHWASQNRLGRPCSHYLDLILKSETDEHDVHMLSEKIGVTSKATIPYIHTGVKEVKLVKAVVGPIASDLTKYDDLLQKLQRDFPDTFDWLLDYFRDDMKVFGYTWNSNSLTSGCNSSPVSNCC